MKIKLLWNIFRGSQFSVMNCQITTTVLQMFPDSFTVPPFPPTQKSISSWVEKEEKFQTHFAPQGFRCINGRFGILKQWADETAEEFIMRF